MLRVAVDTGGTFTDVVATLGGRIFVAKVPSTPDDPARAVAEGVRRARAFFDVDHTHTLTHGTTVATNALLERRGARVMLVTNRGFVDVLDIGRQHRDPSELFCPQPTARPTPVAPGDRLGIAGRRDADGAVVEPLDLPAVATAIAAIDPEPRVWVVALLHSYRDAADEHAVAAIIARTRPDDLVVCSSDVLTESREFERTTTAVASAFVAPTMRRYLDRLRGLAHDVDVMASSGGRIAVQRAAALPVLTALSGPAGGVVAGLALRNQLGVAGVVTLDVGGTSTDVAVIGARADIRRGAHIGDFEIHTPMLDVHTVGAGGGSIARIDALGALVVGPESAGADPGPACYGRGTLPTVTDALLVLGRLDPARPLAADLYLDTERARAAIEPIAATLGCTVAVAAADIVLLAEQAMAHAVRSLSIDRGVDPRELTLVAAGGAGGLHGCGVARQLGMRHVEVPATAGAFCAHGMLAGAPAVERTQTVVGMHPARVEQTRDRLLREAAQALHVPTHSHTCWLGARYREQGHVLEVPFAGDFTDAAEAFEIEHERRFGYRLESEVVADGLRVCVEGLPARDATPPRGDVVRQWTGPCAIGFATHAVWIDADSTGAEYADRSVSIDLGDSTAPAGDRRRAVELTLWRRRLEAVAEEMGQVLMRAAFSPNIRERRDHSCAVFDSAGDMVAQAAHIPVHLGAAPACVKAVLATLALQDGQTAIVNDPFCGGTHLPDITLVTAVDLGPHRMYVASRAHHADVGGIAPGSLPLSRTLHDEGWCTAPVLLTDAVEQSLLKASRTPRERIGDLAAQRAAAHVGSNGLRALANEHGPDAVARWARALLDAGADAIAARLGELPDGDATVEDALHDVAPGVASVRLRLRMRVTHGQLIADFTESGAQVDGPFNAVRSIVESAVFYVLRCLLGPDVPTSSGLLRHVAIRTLPGTIVDATWPAAVAAGNVETSQRLVDLVWRAFEQLAPASWPACSYGSMNNLLIGSLPGSQRPFAYYETIGGGHGAGPRGPGATAMQAHMTNTLNTPVEVLEQSYPLRVRTQAVRRASGGAGHFAGGDGIVRAIELLEPATVTLLAERRRQGAPGAAGGSDGVPGRDWLEIGGVVHPVDGGKISTTVPRGTVVVVQTPGGGGWGVAADPPPADPCETTSPTGQT